MKVLNRFVVSVPFVSLLLIKGGSGYPGIGRLIILPMNINNIPPKIRTFLSSNLDKLEQN